MHDLEMTDLLDHGRAKAVEGLDHEPRGQGQGREAEGDDGLDEQSAPALPGQVPIGEGEGVHGA